MSDGISVSGGGVSSIDTAEMLQARAVAVRIASDVGDLRMRIDRILGTAVDLGHAADTLARARSAADGIVESTASMSAALALAATRYGEGERAITGAVHAAASIDAASFGAALHAALLTSPAVAAALVGGAALAEGYVGLLAGERVFVRTGVFSPFLDPSFDDLIGLQEGSIDDLARGFFGEETAKDAVSEDPDAPFSMQHIATAAGVLLSLIPGTSGPVRVKQVGRTASRRLPTTLSQLISRIQQPRAGKPQITIDEAGVGASRVAIVSVAGTVTFDPLTPGEPFNDVSDLESVGGTVESPAEKAVLQAMAQAGIGKDVPVLFVGHSEGALAVTRAAQDGGYRVKGVITIGGPTGAAQLPANVPVLALQNRDDPVTRLGGSAQGVDNRVVVERSYSVDRSNAAGILPSHERDTYVQTAREAEASQDPQEQHMLSAFAPFFSGELASSNDYRADIGR